MVCACAISLAKLFLFEPFPALYLFHFFFLYHITTIDFTLARLILKLLRTVDACYFHSVSSALSEYLSEITWLDSFLFSFLFTSVLHFFFGFRGVTLNLGLRQYLSYGFSLVLGSLGMIQ